jgi:hypothetical protein
MICDIIATVELSQIAGDLEKSGAPGGLELPTFWFVGLVRNPIVRALSVCQLRVGHFEICPLIGLHGLQHLGRCVTHFILRTDVAKNPEDCEQGFHIPRLTAVLRLRSRLRLPVGFFNRGKVAMRISLERSWQRTCEQEKWPSQSAAISIQRFAVPYIFIGETPAPRCARVCAASAPARKAIRLAATRLWQKVARANPGHCHTLYSRLSAPGVYGGNKGQASAVPTGSSPSLRTGVLRGESDDQFLARHPVRISHAFQ